MPDTIDIIVPDLGEFENVEVIEVLVGAGDTVVAEDGLITIETDKASMDIPSPADGTIKSLSVSVGSTVSGGDKIGELESESEQVTPAPDADAAPAESVNESVEAADSTVDTGGADEGVAGSQTLVVPDIGDFENVDVIEVHIAAGDTVDIDDSLITLETDKAAMDVPAVLAGTVTAVLVKVGDKVAAGSAIVEMDAVATTSAEAVSPPQSPEPETPTSTVREAPPKRSAEAPASPIDESGFSKAHASPSVRKLARELGVNLVQVKGSGAKGRVLHDDVKAFVKSVMTGQVASPMGGGLPKTPVVDFSKFGETDVQPLSRIQKISGPRLQASWINLPHVTQHDVADITELEARRQELKGAAKERGISLTPLAFVMKACVAALEEFPTVNASLSDDGKNLVFKKYCHLGFAADTPNGLVVPVIRDADKKDVYEIAAELGTLSALGREGKLMADQMQGASFTISSLGGIGGTAFTPIVNAPEVAILGVSRSSMQPVWSGTHFEPRLMLPLSLSYDHRVIDGAQAVRFTTFLGATLANVDELLAAIP